MMVGTRLNWHRARFSCGLSWIYLWSSSGQSSWLQIQSSGFDSQSYHIFWEAVGLGRGPLSFVITIKELLERKSSGSGLEIREYSRRDPSRWPRRKLNSQRLALTSPKSGGRSVGIVHSWTQATEFSFIYGPSVFVGAWIGGGGGRRTAWIDYSKTILQ
jgi:hypothetical protein